MKRTVSIKLRTTPEQRAALLALQKEYNRVCNLIVPIATNNQCFNRVGLHHLAYYPVRIRSKLVSQLVCNAIKSVADAYKVLKIKKVKKMQPITFKPYSSISIDKRTYSFKTGALSLYTLSGRIVVPMVIGGPQQEYLRQGIPKEGKLVYKNGTWFFKLVCDLPEVQPIPSSGKVLGIDLGENTLAATSSGKLFDGKLLRHERDCSLAARRRLQSNGSKSAKRRLRKTSGREARHVSYVNHCISKALVQEALDTGSTLLALENLTHIGSRIVGNKRIKCRLHRWPWAQLQTFILYKAQAAGLKVVLVNPAYTSKLCSECGQKGIRTKHRFVCQNCGIQRHSDLNAARNIRRIAVSADAATGAVNHRHIAAV